MAEEELRFRAVGQDVSAGRMLDKLAKGADGAAEEISQLDRELKHFDDQISTTEAHLRGLISEFAKTGDQKIFKDIRRDRAQLGMLAYLRKQLAGEVSTSVGSGILDALAALPAQLKGGGMAIGAGLGLAAAPFIGSAIGAAVIGGVGIGGIVGGIAAAAQDPRVKTAGTNLSESIGESFAGVGKPFVDPLLDSMGQLEGIGSAFFSNLEDDIAPLADHLDNLADGAAGFARNFDLSAAVEAAGPLIDVIGEELPEVGEALTDMLDTIAEESDGLAIGMKQLFDIMQSGIRVTGDVIGTLAAINEEMVDLSASTGEAADVFLERFAPIAPGLIPLALVLSDAGGKAGEFTEAVIRSRGPVADLDEELQGVGADAAKAAEELMTFSDAIDNAFGRQMDLDEATSAYKQGVKDLTKELREGERTLSDNTQAGRDNAANAREWLQNIEDVRMATIAQTGDVKGANKAFDEQVGALKRVLLNLGYDKKAVEELIAAYRNIPKLIETHHRVITTFRGGGGEGGEFHQGGKRAMAGEVVAGRTYWVGERGPEPVTFGENGRILSVAQAAGRSGGGGSAAPVALSVGVTLSASPGTDQAVVDWLIPRLQIEVNSQGGNVQDVLGRVGG